ncbi:SDR family NAD(P)-dependent oxidoreductase [Leptospira harrisiae]|uniref:Short-chain dehydrogenase n=1 Tax=Leptospira harrisiae TaxID=2023189 RepID=A0A2N0ANG0_9LEPT|nr:SDR family NAD(P)-dependent oxidoreductase [Leptospira harrisiae]PJZ85864.1 short-chain dehydrogenase [Leptospira harrisiae]PKA09427.1 short-chain dehydrogenase [Leptospira harrisiae]
MKKNIENQTNKIALITGGGGAIAEAIALRLEEEGYQLLLSDISLEKMSQVKEKLKGNPRLFVCDQTNPDEIQNLIHSIQKDYPEISVLINNAGYTKEGPFISQTLNDIQRQIWINLISPIQITHGILPLMLKRGEGAIVSIVSIGGIIALADSSLYSAGKFGLRGFLTALYEELKNTKIKVSGIYPAAVDTPMLLHEALNGGTALNWVNQVQSPDKVARAVMKGIKKGTLEIYVPYSDGLISRLVAVFPALMGKLSPVLLWIGKRNQQKWLKAKGIINQ